VIVALVSDFGTRDHYVGSMKAVVLSVCPEATLVDITHEIAPQDVLGGALELAAAYRYFPAGTVFLAVVDPGVGSGRRAIAADAGGYRFVGPDNGVLSLALLDAAPGLARVSDSGPIEPINPINPTRTDAQIVELRERRLARPQISRTFEGRDRFAPAAGWLAKGIELRAFGPDVCDPVLLAIPSARVHEGSIDGEVLRVDRFGNLVTNIGADSLARVVRTGAVVAIADRTARLVATYADAKPLELCALVGSTGHLEVSVNAGNAATDLKAGRGARVIVRSR
jgi:S-adenosylmethionine hydrolase